MKSGPVPGRKPKQNDFRGLASLESWKRHDRLSPDHGTAFDIAGQGIANPTSLIEALKLAAKMAASA